MEIDVVWWATRENKTKIRKKSSHPEKRDLRKKWLLFTTTGNVNVHAWHGCGDAPSCWAAGQLQFLTKTDDAVSFLNCMHRECMSVKIVSTVGLSLAPFDLSLSCATQMFIRSVRGWMHVWPVASFGQKERMRMRARGPFENRESSLIHAARYGTYALYMCVRRPRRKLIDFPGFHTLQRPTSYWLGTSHMHVVIVFLYSTFHTAPKKKSRYVGKLQQIFSKLTQNNGL